MARCHCVTASMTARPGAALLTIPCAAPAEFCHLLPNQKRLSCDYSVVKGATPVQRGLQNALNEYLVLLAKAGDQEAFGRLVVRWSPRLLAFATRSTGATEAAKDVVQETWVSAVRSLGRLDDPARFPAWIFAITARKCTDVLRAKYRGQRMASSLENDAALEPAPASDADAHLDLAAALQRLPREQRIAVALLYGEDMSVAEIAAVMGVPPGTVKSRLSAARQALRHFMEGERDE